MLVDSTHKRWALATVVLAVVTVAVYQLFAWNSPGGLSGGSTVGLWYGVLGSALMVFAGLLAVLRRVPSWWWIGSRQAWLRGHIWLGLLSGLFILCHSGYRWGGPLTMVLWLVTLGVLATGILGLFLQQLVPRVLTLRVQAEAPYEQIPHLCRLMRRKADALIDALCGAQDVGTQNVENTRGAMRLQEDGRLQLRMFYEQDVRPFLGPEAPRSSPLLNPLTIEARFAKLRKLSGLGEAEEDLQKLATLCDERRQLAEQERLWFWLHAWLAVHVPLSVALLVLGVLHVVTALYF